MNNNIDIKYIKLNDKAVTPFVASDHAAGADLYLCEDSLTIPPHETVLTHTGLAFEIPTGIVGLIFARSSLALKRHLAPANKVGVIDSDYRGEIMVPLHNHSDSPVSIEEGERIAQILFMPYFTPLFTETDSLSDTKRGDGGFGSTGRN